MNKMPSQELRESTRLLMRKLGFLERGEAGCCGITYTQCHAIVETGRRAELSVNELAEVLGLDKSTISKTVEQLVQSGIMLREQSKTDRRFVVVKLTEKGREVFHSIETRMEKYFADILNSIPEVKQVQVIESVKLLADALTEKRYC